MIAAKDPSPSLTPEEYLAWEEKQLEKHEYIDGHVRCPFRQQHLRHRKL
jgi:Uma2 family endonuclease